MRQFRGHSAAVSDMRVSEDCRWLLSASLDGTVRCWDIPGGWRVWRLLLLRHADMLSLNPLSAMSTSI